MQGSPRDQLPLDPALLKKVVDYTETVQFRPTKNGVPKFSIPWMVAELNGKLLVKLQNEFRKLDDQKADVVDFVKVILDTFVEEDKEKLFLIVCAVEFYKRITEVYGLDKHVHFRDLTNFIIDVTLPLRGYDE
jgi:hypothetical protein